MVFLLKSVVFLCCFTLAVFTNPECIIELECDECVPENLPLVTSHRAINGTLVAAEGDELVLACHGGKFLQYPLHDVVTAVCEAGRYRVRQDSALRHLLELGCQENIFEDVLHQVDNCGSPLQGRAYKTTVGQRSRHLATLCFDEDRGTAVRVHACSAPHNQLSLPPHHEARAPLSLLGNFNHMFDAKTRNDAEKLYGDDARMNRRLRELFKHEKVLFAEQRLTSGKLLSGAYFEDQNARVTDFVSNKVPVWGSVAAGNLRNLHRDVAQLMKQTRPHTILDVYAGTHGALSLRAGEAGGRAELYLRPGNRFPVPKYIWTVVHDKKTAQAVALVVVNDPFIAVSEIRDTLFCESACSRMSWLRELRRHRNYETPLYGLVFCCNVHQFTSVVTEMPKSLFANVPLSNDGLLTQFFA